MRVYNQMWILLLVDDKYICYMNVLYMRIYNQMWILLVHDQYICYMNVLYDENIQPNVDIIASGR